MAPSRPILHPEQYALAFFSALAIVAGIVLLVTKVL
jgi:hypothetical protein